jgi:type II secretory ATPase GspE/PulE/Tfp pilus assembly ATPase PilB-like protein
MDIESKIKEADAYQSMGLLRESLHVYKEVLASISKSEPHTKETLNNKIRLLKKEIENTNKNPSEEISNKDISIIKQAVSASGSVSEMIDAASSLKELGLIQDAVDKYKELLKSDYPVRKIIPELMTCLIEIHSPHEVVKHIERILTEYNLNNTETAWIKFSLGLEMEKRGHKDLTIGLCKEASGLDQGNQEYKDKLNQLTSTVSSGSRYDYLLNRAIITADQLQKALNISKKLGKSVEAVLLDHFKVKKEEVGKSLSHYYGCKYRTFDPKFPVPVELVSNLKKSFLMQDMWVPMKWGKKGIEILIYDPKNLQKTDQIRALIKTSNIIFSVGTKEDIKQYITHFFDTKADESLENIIENLDMIPDISFEEEEYTEPEEDTGAIDESSSQVVKLVDQVLVSAYRTNVSDIHIEPSPVSRRTEIRFRLDGVCQEYIQVPLSMSRALISRIKIMANLDIAERRLPQDGKIKFKRKGIPPFELRLATMPTAGGFEDAVLRILAKAGAMKLDEMGLVERNMKVMKKILAQPYGLILVVGPTGSGKTTSLHAALGYINKPGIKIWTAEDPVEITQSGLRQVEVKPKIGLDFARVMRSFLRLDPDVIMIGEMRDYETASTGVEASLTGHLVFSTLHTNSAPETVTRLLDMGLNALNFSDAFLGVLAQRLVRRLCTNCRKAYHPSEEEFEDIVREYGQKGFEAKKLEYNSDLILYRSAGCDLCSGSGYKGRMGIHELMEGTPSIKDLIKREGTSEDLFSQALKEGMTTLKQDGIHKVLQGLTDMNEIRRVCIE